MSPAGAQSKFMTRRACPRRAFTLLELLVVIGIIALLATIGVGALRGFNAVNVVQAGNRQLLDDINRARNSAQNERTTVYMVFVPPLNLFPLGSLTNAAQRMALTNRFSGQYSSYNFVELRTPGDQPGRGRARYLSEWKHLPNGVFINTNEFLPKPPLQWLAEAATNTSFKPDMPFTYLSVPFPTASSPSVLMPCIAFNYRGGVSGPDLDKPRQVDEIVTLTRGSLILPVDAKEKPLFTSPPEIIETPKGNSTNNPYIRIDWITGRPRLEGA
jgi:prepilin-type N-terminal cleavage/methylation domain-containing protein